MITLLCGENDYELTKKVAQLNREFDGTSERFDAAELTREQLADIFAGQTLFAMKRLVLLDGPSTNPELWQNLATWGDRLSEDTQLVLIEPKTDKRTAAYKWLKNHADVHEFSPLDSRDIRGITRWIEAHAKSEGLNLTTKHASRLAQRVGPDQWELAHAIDKLTLAGEVSDQWIDDVSQASPAENVFALFETTLSGDINRLQAMLETLRQTEDPYRIFGLINSQVLQLTVLVYGDGNVSKVASDSGATSAYPLQKLAPYAVRVNKSKARSMVALLADADVRLKSSDANPWTVLESTLSQMTPLK